MKRFFILLLCLALAVSLVGAAFAEGECAHANRHRVTVVDRDYPIYSQAHPETGAATSDPDQLHWVTYEAWEYWECDACGERFSGKPLPEQNESEQQAHILNGGACPCGYQQPVLAANFDPDDEWEELEIRKGAPYTVISDRIHESTVYSVKTGAVLGTAREHHSYDDDGVCDICGHENKCTHPKPYGTHLEGDPDFKYIDAEYCGGTYKNNTMLIWCTKCGEILQEDVPAADYEAKMRHDFRTDDNDETISRCIFCGYEVRNCTHPSTKTVTSVNDTLYEPLVSDVGNADYHVIWGQWTVKEVWCTVCGQRISYEDEEGAGSVQEAHDYDAFGICETCGHEDPSRAVKTTDAPTAATTSEATAAPTTAPTATPAPAGYVAVPAVHGVAASDGLTAVAAMQIVGRSLAGENATVSIPEFEKLLSADERARFDRLSVEERLLVVLSALGYGNSADLSAEAQALAADLAGMGATAVETLKVTVNSQEYDAVRLVVEVTRGGQLTRERYTFYDNGSQWMLYGVEVWQ